MGLQLYIAEAACGNANNCVTMSRVRLMLTRRPRYVSARGHLPQNVGDPTACGSVTDVFVK